MLLARVRRELTQNVAFFTTLMTVDISIWEIRTSICSRYDLLASRRLDFGRCLIELRFFQDGYRPIMDRDTIRKLAFM